MLDSPQNLSPNSLPATGAEQPPAAEPTARTVGAPSAGTAPPPSEKPDFGNFSLAQARAIVGESFRPKPWVYWTDLLVSWSIAMATFQAVQAAALGWPVRIACFFVSAMLIYRCSLFIHELMHLPEGTMPLFRRAWNPAVRGAVPDPVVRLPDARRSPPP